MASLIKMVFSIALLALAVLVSTTLATDHIVGDEKGWTLNFDYQAWAQGKDFRVGDKLVFNYNKGTHNVLKVNGTGFQQCSAVFATGEALISGNDVVTLATPGQKWYICGVGKHCEVGKMKLVITVLAQDNPGSPTPSPTGNPIAAPTSSPTGNPIAAPTSAGVGAGETWLKYVAVVAPLAVMLMLIV